MTFEEILRMRQKELKHALSKHLKGQGYSVVSQKGFLYAEGDIPVLLVAHLDTVHSEIPHIICYSPDKRYMMSPQGIGGDDRCGVYINAVIFHPTTPFPTYQAENHPAKTRTHRFLLRSGWNRYSVSKYPRHT